MVLREPVMGRQRCHDSPAVEIYEILEGRVLLRPLCTCLQALQPPSMNSRDHMKSCTAADLIFVVTRNLGDVCVPKLATRASTVAATAREDQKP